MIVAGHARAESTQDGVVIEARIPPTAPKPSPFRSSCFDGRLDDNLPSNANCPSGFCNRWDSAISYYVFHDFFYKEFEHLGSTQLQSLSKAPPKRSARPVRSATVLVSAAWARNVEVDFARKPILSLDTHERHTAARRTAKRGATMLA